MNGLCESDHLETDKNLSIERKLKIFVSNASKSFGEITKSNEILAHREACFSRIEETLDDIRMNNESDNALFSAIEKKIRERKKLRLQEIHGSQDSSSETPSISEFKAGKRERENFNFRAYKLISQFYLIKKFIKALRNTAFVRQPNKYQIERLHILNDNAFFKEGVIQNFFPEKFGKSKSLNSLSYGIHILKEKLGFIGGLLNGILKTNHPWILDPDHPFHGWWDAVHLIVILFFFFKFPVELTFGINLKQELERLDSHSFAWIEWFSFFFLLLDIMLNFNTGYYKKGCLITSKRQIFKNYIRTSFPKDILSFIPIILETQGMVIHELIKLLFAFRIYNFFRIFARMEQSVHMNLKLFNLLALLKTIVRIVLLSHVFACGWNLITYPQGDKDRNWYN